LNAAVTVVARPLPAGSSSAIHAVSVPAAMPIASPLRMRREQPRRTCGEPEQKRAYRREAKRGHRHGSAADLIGEPPEREQRRNVADHV